MKTISITISVLYIMFSGLSTFSQAIDRSHHFEGTWNTIYGDLRIVANHNNSIFGDYHNVGVLYGGIEKKADGTYWFSGTFENYNVGKKGMFGFKIPVKNNLYGQWQWRGEVNQKKDWTGTKKSATKPQLKYFYKTIVHHYDKKKKLQPATYSLAAFQDGILRLNSEVKTDSYEIMLPKGTWQLRLMGEHRKVIAETTIVIKEGYPGKNNYYKINLYE